MLSATNSITDAKFSIDIYGFFGFDSDAEYVTFLTACFENIKDEYMLRYMSEGTYDAIAAKDKVGLDMTERRIYMAEVNFARSELFRTQRALELARRRAEIESINNGGVVSTSDGLLGKESAEIHFYSKAVALMSLAGYRVLVQGQRIGNKYLDEDEYNEFPGVALS